MDPVSSLSALASQASTAAPSGSVMGNHLVQQGNGMTFSFELPKAVGATPPAQGASALPAAQSVSGVSSSDGGGTVVKMVNQVNNYQASAGEKVRDVLMGNGNATLDDAMVASQEAGVAFKLLAEVRNKAIDSYQEIMRMQI
ncbi:MAG TPA: flagellar hook-basal body complex protein FliE [Candidatus Methylacidiphilales bacterium]